MKQPRVILPDSWRGTTFILVVSLGARLLLFFGTQTWPVTPDGAIHLQRVRALVDAWSMGTLYPRWFPDFAFGYGHPILHYYAPFTYVGPALLHVLGVDVLTATRFALALVYGTSGLIAYWAVRPWLSPGGALTVDLLFMAFPYRLYDLFVRGALPEFAAFFWLPLLLGTLLRLLLADKLNRTHLAVAGLAWAGLALTHNLTLLMAAIFAIAAVPFAAIHPRVYQSTSRRGRRRNTPYLARLRTVALRSALAAGLGALLSAFYILPTLLEARWVGIGITPSAQGYLNHLVGWRDLIQWRFQYTYPTADLPTVPLAAPWLIVAAAGLVLLLVERRRTKLRVVLPLTALVITMWLTTSWSAPVWALVDPVLGKLQFPWRWQSLAALPFALVGGVVVDAIVHHRRNWIQMSVALVIGLGATWVVLPRNFIATTPTITRQEMWTFDATQGQIGATWTGEFLPRWVQAPRWAIDEAPTDPQPPDEATASTTGTSGELEIDAVPLQQGYLNSTFRISTAMPVRLTLDQFYFPAWHIALDGESLTPVPRGELGLLSVTVPAGTHQLDVAWRATQAVWLGRLLSTIGWTLVALLFWYARRDLELVGWGLVGLVAVAGMAGWTQRTVVPTPVDADYGRVELTAATATPAHPGDFATVQLYWLLRAATENGAENAAQADTPQADTPQADTPQDLVVFVHIVAADDPTNFVVAQWDEPIGGPYRPPARWQTPELLRQTVHVPLPPDLPPGDYRVLGGVYRAGASDAPLVPTEESTEKSTEKNEARRLLDILRVER